MRVSEIADQTTDRLMSASRYAEKAYLRQRRELAMAVTRTRAALERAMDPAERSRLERELREALEKERDLKRSWDGSELRKWTGRARAYESHGSEARAAWTQRPLAPAAKSKAAPSARRIEGYAAVFDRETIIFGAFRERVRQGAFSDVVNTCDCRALVNHNPDLLLGRTASFTLELSERRAGLWFSCKALPYDSLTNGVIARIRRGDLSGCSFAFTVAEDEWTFPTIGLPSRTIIRIDGLYDVGPVTYPAYEDTTVNVTEEESAAKPESIDEYCQRMELEEFEEIEREAEIDRRVEERLRAMEVERMYEDCGRIIAECQKAGA